MANCKETTPKLKEYLIDKNLKHIAMPLRTEFAIYSTQHMLHYTVDECMEIAQSFHFEACETLRYKGMIRQIQSDVQPERIDILAASKRHILDLTTPSPEINLKMEPRMCSIEPLSLPQNQNDVNVMDMNTDVQSQAGIARPDSFDTNSHRHTSTEAESPPHIVSMTRTKTKTQRPSGIGSATFASKTTKSRSKYLFKDYSICSVHEEGLCEVEKESTTNDNIHDLACTNCTNTWMDDECKWCCIRVGCTNIFCDVCVSKDIKQTSQQPKSQAQEIQLISLKQTGQSSRKRNKKRPSHFESSSGDESDEDCSANNTNSSCSNVDACVRGVRKNKNSHSNNRSSARVLEDTSDKDSYPCDECNKLFVHEWTLKRHKRWHLKNKLFCCDVCDKSFARKRALTKHKLIHLGEKTFQCDKCSYSCDYKWNLKTHKRVHSGEKPYDCMKCSKKFAHASNRNIHQKKCCKK